MQHQTLKSYLRLGTGKDYRAIQTRANSEPDTRQRHKNIDKTSDRSRSAGIAGAKCGASHACDNNEIPT